MASTNLGAFPWNLRPNCLMSGMLWDVESESTIPDRRLMCHDPVSVVRKLRKGWAGDSVKAIGRSWQIKYTADLQCKQNHSWTLITEMETDRHQLGSSNSILVNYWQNLLRCISTLRLLAPIWYMYSKYTQISRKPQYDQELRELSLLCCEFLQIKTALLY